MSTVALFECRSYDTDLVMAKINSAVELLGGWEKYVQSGNTVLLKVNLIGPKPSSSAAVTHCEFVRAMIRILKARGCTVWIGDSAGGAIGGIAPTAQAMKAAGYEKVVEEEDALIKNFDREGAVGITPKSGMEETMYIAKPYIDADVVINLPKLKTHSAGIFTGAVKNVFGCIPGLRKAKYHKMAPDPADLGHIFCDIHDARKISLHIMDGVTAMQGEGPTAGTVYEAHKILAGEDPLALDVIAAKMVGLNISDIPILQTAQKRGMGEGDIAKIQLAGDYSSIPALSGFVLPKRFIKPGKRNGKALIKIIDFFQTRPNIDLSKCKKCNMCVESCPVQAIDKETKRIDYSACIECMCCHELCMYKAVELKNTNVIAGVISRMARR